MRQYFYFYTSEEELPTPSALEEKVGIFTVILTHWMMLLLISRTTYYTVPNF